MVIILVFCVFTTRATRWQHQFVPTAFNDSFTIVNAVHFTRGYVMGLSMPSTATVSFGSHSMKHFYTILWNSLPSDF